MEIDMAAYVARREREGRAPAGRLKHIATARSQSQLDLPVLHLSVSLPPPDPIDHAPTMASSPTVREVASEGVAAPTAPAPEAARQGEVKRSAPTARETAMLPLSMVAVQVIVVGMLLLSKLTLSAGMSPFIILVYRNMIAAAAVAPLAVYFERYVRVLFSFLFFWFFFAHLESIQGYSFS
jgi:hypothetical protein